jgi:NAD(P)-dependent dehydrogenase (short-subunit alcohol dehydrogenase family)
MATDANLTPGRELSGKVVLVTGAARNIGRAIVRALAAGGANVMVNALRSRHAIGSLERPMTDADLGRKFHDLVDPVLGAARVTRLIEQCGALAACDDVRGFTART